jgi:hypothetical protein
MLALLILILFACQWFSCAFKDMPEDEMVEWKLIKIEQGMRNDKPIDIQIWEVRGIERRIVGHCPYPVGIILIWPVNK